MIQTLEFAQYLPFSTTDPISRGIHFYLSSFQILRNLQKRFLLLFFIGLIVQHLPQAVCAKIIPQTEIHITLLGQPCLLQGPFDVNTLKEIHAIGPAQLFPYLSTNDFMTSKIEGKKALAKIRNNFGIPSLLDHYRDKVLRRLEAQLAFLDAAENANQIHQITLLRKISNQYLQRDFSKFENLLNKLESTRKNLPVFHELIEQTFEAFNDAIEPNPEEDFHRAINKLNIQYLCSFEENEDHLED